MREHIKSIASRGWQAFRPRPRHPIDRAYGIETSAHLPNLLLGYKDAAAAKSSCGYAGSQPSIIRTALATIPDLSGAWFIDIGCGKGRALAVATEYPFSRIVGLELSPSLWRVAAANVGRIAQRHPDRLKAQVLCADASAPELPDRGVAVVYLYNPFRADLMTRLLSNIQAAVRRAPALKVFVVYCNPTQGALLDASRAFRRHFAAPLEFSPDEAAASHFGNAYDNLAIWQSVGGEMHAPKPGCDREIRVTVPDIAAEISLE